MSIRLSRLVSGTRLVDKDGSASVTFQRYWQTFAEQIERALTLIGDFLGITDQLQQAIDQANQAIVIAQEAAEVAQEAAEQAQQQTDAAKRETALQSSYIDPASVLSATPTLITIAPHTRYYPQTSGDPTAVEVDGGSVSATGAGDIDYVFYTDAAREGGSVSYQVETSPPTQTGGTHVVGAVTVPSAGSVAGGEGPQRPGFVRPNEIIA